MNNIVKYIKITLLTTLAFLTGMYIFRFYILYPPKKTGIELNIYVVIMLILLILLFLINIIDIFVKKYKVYDKFKYNLITIIGIIPINIIFVRLLFDKSIIANVKSNIITNDVLIGQGHSFIEYNSFIIIIITFLLITYRLVNNRKSTK